MAAGPARSTSSRRRAPCARPSLKTRPDSVPAMTPLRLVAGMMIFGALFAVLAPLWRGDPDEPQTSFGWTDSGHRAFVELLEKLGAPVRRWRAGPDRLTGTGRMLLLIEPGRQEPDDRRLYAEGLRRWVDAGNTL